MENGSNGENACRTFCAAVTLNIKISANGWY
jgi:hypothetical protein